MIMIMTGIYTVAEDTMTTAHAVDQLGNDGNPSNNLATETTLVVVP